MEIWKPLGLGWCNWAAQLTMVCNMVDLSLFERVLIRMLTLCFDSLVKNLWLHTTFIQIILCTAPVAIGETDMYEEVVDQLYFVNIGKLWLHGRRYFLRIYLSTPWFWYVISMILLLPMTPTWDNICRPINNLPW